MSAASSDTHAVPHLARPALKPEVLGLVIIGAVIGWGWLIADVAVLLATTDLTTLGPGMSVLNGFSRTGDLPESVRAAIGLLCSPASGRAWTLGDAGQALAMWSAMVLAMMLPSAAPVLNQATAAASHAIRTAVILASGYLSIWFAFACLATALEGALVATRVMQSAMAPMTDVLAATTMMAAGVYQFTAWKTACLGRCRNPAPAFLPPDATSVGTYTLGLRLGLDCLGCCWALMTVMFAVGTMNVIWIAALAAVMTLEKLARGPLVRWAIGIALIGVGAMILLASPIGARLIAAL